MQCNSNQQLEPKTSLTRQLTTEYGYTIQITAALQKNYNDNRTNHTAQITQQPRRNTMIIEYTHSTNHTATQEKYNDDRIHPQHKSHSNPEEIQW